jgi:hypothetical protein
MPSASVIGREHARVGRNNQDGWAEVARGSRQVVVVCDGCSSQPFSEVGARLGAHHVAQACLNGPLEGVMHQAAEATKAMLEVFAAQGTLERYGLFTVLAAVHEAGVGVVFGAGDGLWAADGRVAELASDANAPDYAAYGLAHRERGQWKQHFFGPATEMVVASDGFGEALASEPQALAELIAPPVVWRNPAALQRGLNLLSARLRLADDCTVVAMRGGV